MYQRLILAKIKLEKVESKRYIYNSWDFPAVKCQLPLHRHLFDGGAGATIEVRLVQP